jgi:DNA-binding transcriptional LysR family regulator
MKMDRFRAMSVFVAVAEAESFAAASRKLGMSPPAVTRAIAALESRLRVKLLHRTTRHVRATDAGQRYLENVRRILTEADAIDAAASGNDAVPGGSIAITAPVLFGRMFVMPIVVEYLWRFAEMSVSALLVDRVVNLLEEGLDVGVRIGELPDSTMRAIGVGHLRRIVCASPDYLSAQGVPQTPSRLAKHTIIATTAVSSTMEWHFVSGGRPIRVKLAPRLAVTSNDAALDAAVRGFGVTRLLSYQAAAELAAGKLVALLTDYEPPRLPIHVVHREDRYGSARVRSFVDWLVDRLRADKALR